MIRILDNLLVTYKIVHCATRGENELFLTVLPTVFFFNEGMTGPFFVCESERGLGISSRTQHS